jgi:FecR-like protein
MKQYALIVLTIFTPVMAFSQEEATISIAFEEVLVSEVLFSLEEQFNVRFSYRDNDLADLRVTLERKDRTLSQVLIEIEDIVQISFQNVSDRYISVNGKGSGLNEILRLERVLINGYLGLGISKYTNGTYGILPKRLEILPGLTEPDILESIQLLPGVVSSNETASGLIVRGGTSDQNRMIWNGIDIYHKGHLFGMISPFNPNVIQKVTFHNKGTHPRYGERVSSVIEMESAHDDIDLWEAGMGITALNVDAFVRMPVIKDQLSIDASVRRSYNEIYESFTFNALADKVFQSTKIDNTENAANNFFFLDANVRVNYRPDERNSISMSAIYIDNDLDYLVTDMNSSQSFNDLMTIKNEGYGSRWDVIWSDKVRQRTQLSFSKYQFSYKFLTLEDDQQIREFQKQNAIYDTSFSSEVEINTYGENDLSVGYQYGFKDVSYAFRDTADLDFILDADQNVINTHSLFANYSLRPGRRLEFRIGLRTNYYRELDKIRFEPRLLFQKGIFKNLKLQISGEIKNQIISEIDETVLSDLSLENRLWRLANEDTFPIINSWQVSAGIIYTNKGWSLDIDNYYKKIDGISALSLGFLNPNDAQFHIGEREILGLDFYLKKDFKPFKTWLSYSFSNAKSKFEGLNNDKDFTASTNIRHAVTTSVAFRKKQFQIALAWHWRTGKPFTQRIIPFDPNSPVEFIGINGERLPSYHRLDFSTTYDFYFSKDKKIKGKVGFSIRNVYNQNNQLSREYFGNNNLDDPIRVVDKFSIGITPNFLFRASF